MHAEARLPVVSVGDIPGSGVGTRREGTLEKAIRRRRALDFRVSDIEAYVEVLGDVPLGSRADPPPVPVVVTASIGHRVSTITNTIALKPCTGCH